MSALGHKQTFAAQKGMSALPPKADMCSATRYVRFVPKADIAPSLHYIIGSHYSSKTPRITETHRPLIHIPISWLFRFSASASSKLGRPMSMP